jgi:four helix bundle protein
MATIQRFEELEAWKTARELTQLVYQVSNQGAFTKDFGLRDQMRCASVSVLSNIAEGFESRTTTLFIDFLGRAKGSCGEVRAQNYVALDAGYIDQEQHKKISELSTSCSRQLYGFAAYLEGKRGEPR